MPLTIQQSFNNVCQVVEAHKGTFQEHTLLQESLAALKQLVIEKLDAEKDSKQALQSEVR